MKSDSSKFLVNFLNGFTHTQLFFAFWGGIVFGFVFLFYSYYKKSTKRNFRAPGQGTGPHIPVNQPRIGQSHHLPSQQNQNKK
jgi:hypothetical protein